MEVVKKAEEIEKYAHNVKEEMKAAQWAGVTTWRCRSAHPAHGTKSHSNIAPQAIAFILGGAPAKIELVQPSKTNPINDQKPYLPMLSTGAENLV